MQNSADNHQEMFNVTFTTGTVATVRCDEDKENCPDSTPAAPTSSPVLGISSESPPAYLDFNVNKFIKTFDFSDQESDQAKRVADDSGIKKLPHLESNKQVPMPPPRAKKISPPLVPPKPAKREFLECIESLDEELRKQGDSSPDSSVDNVDRYVLERTVIDIHEGQGVEGKVEDNKTIVVTKIPHPCSSVTRQRKESSRSLENPDLIQSQEVDGGKSRIFETPRRKMDINLTRYPKFMRADDVFALYSPSQKCLQVRKCPRDNIVGKEMEDFLTLEAITAFDSGLNKTFSPDTRSLEAVVGSPRPVMDVSAVLFDGPDVLQPETRTVRLYDAKKNRYGVVEKIGNELTHLEILKSGNLIADVSLDDLMPTKAARIRCGEYVSNGPWIGMVRQVERSVVLRLVKNNKKVKLVLDEVEAEGTLIGYLSGTRVFQGDQKDFYMDPAIPMYPGQIIKVDKRLADEEMAVCPSRISHCLFAGFELLFRRGRDNYNFVNPRQTERFYEACVQKVEISAVQVIWIECSGNAQTSFPPSLYNSDTLEELEILAPLSKSVCELNSIRTYKIKEDDVIVTPDVWMQEVADRYIFTDGNPCVDQVDKTSPGSVVVQASGRSKTLERVHQRLKSFRKRSKNVAKPGEEVMVRIVLKFRTAQVSWEDGTKQNLEMPRVLQMILNESDLSGGSDNIQSNLDLERSNLPAQSPNDIHGAGDATTATTGSFADAMNDFLEFPELDASLISKHRSEHFVGIESIGIKFKEGDFVIDAQRQYPSTMTEYGIIKQIYPEDYMVKVDWFFVREYLVTTKLDPEAKRQEVSVFDILPMDSNFDPLFRVKWRSSPSYGSEIVCRRWGLKLDNGFEAGYFHSVDENGQLVIHSSNMQGEEKIWKLWPCEVTCMKNSCYQDPVGDWKLVSRDKDPTKPMTAFQAKLLTHNEQVNNGEGSPFRAKSFPKLINTPGSEHEFKFSDYENIEGYEERIAPFQVDPVAPKSHLMYHMFEELYANEIENLKSELSLEVERVSVLGLPDGVFLRGYEDRWNLFSLLIVGPKTSVYYGGVFVFDIAFVGRSQPLIAYVSYTTKLSVLLGDSCDSARLQPLRMFDTESLGDSLAFVNTIENVGDGDAEVQLVQNRPFQGSSSTISSSAQMMRNDSDGVVIGFDLKGAVDNLYRELFETPPHLLVMGVSSCRLSPRELPVYSSFLRGKVIESLRNFLDIPHSPWEGFVAFHMPELQRVLLGVKDDLEKSVRRDVIQENGWTVPCIEGVRMFLRNRLKYFL